MKQTQADSIWFNGKKRSWSEKCREAHSCKHVVLAMGDCTAFGSVRSAWWWSFCSTAYTLLDYQSALRSERLETISPDVRPARQAVRRRHPRRRYRNRQAVRPLAFRRCARPGHSKPICSTVPRRSMRAIAKVLIRTGKGADEAPVLVYEWLRDAAMVRGHLRSGDGQREQAVGLLPVIGARKDIAAWLIHRTR